VGSINSIVGISQRFRRKHFTSSRWTGSISICWHFAALSPEAFHIVKVGGKHQHMLAFHSAFAGSISHRQSECMTGSISLLLGVSTIRRWEAFLSVRANQ
jgi:hypothetical protein